MAFSSLYRRSGSRWCAGHDCYKRDRRVWHQHQPQSPLPPGEDLCESPYCIVATLLSNTPHTDIHWNHPSGSEPLLSTRNIREGTLSTTRSTHIHTIHTRSTHIHTLHTHPHAPHYPHTLHTIHTHPHTLHTHPHAPHYPHTLHTHPHYHTLSTLSTLYSPHAPPLHTRSTLSTHAIHTIHTRSTLRYPHYPHTLHTIHTRSTLSTLRYPHYPHTLHTTLSTHYPHAPLLGHD